MTEVTQPWACSFTVLNGVETMGSPCSFPVPRSEVPFSHRKLGYFTMPIHPPGRNYTQTLKEDREAVLLADRLGFIEAFIGEHITDVCETIPSCLSFIASVAHETKQIRLGCGTLNLPNSHRRRSRRTSR